MQGLMFKLLRDRDPDFSVCTRFHDVLGQSSTSSKPYKCILDDQASGVELEALCSIAVLDIRTLNNQADEQA